MYFKEYYIDVEFCSLHIDYYDLMLLKYSLQQCLGPSSGLHEYNPKMFMSLENGMSLGFIEYSS